MMTIAIGTRVNAPLDGIRILDFSTLLPGPMASLILAEAGAEVIKIERPHGGDGLRSYEPKWGDDSASFSMLNRGKKSIAIDLKRPETRERLIPLIQEADIVLEQFRPGVMDRLKLGYRDLIKIKPDLIYWESVTKSGVLIVEGARDRQSPGVVCVNGSDVRETTKPSCPARGAEGGQPDRRSRDLGFG